MSSRRSFYCDAGFTDEEANKFSRQPATPGKQEAIYLVTKVKNPESRIEKISGINASLRWARVKSTEAAEWIDPKYYKSLKDIDRLKPQGY